MIRLSFRRLARSGSQPRPFAPPASSVCPPRPRPSTPPNPRQARRQARVQTGREGRGFEALPGRDLRRLERVRRRSGQGAHLLHPRAAEIARTREPQARSGLCVHLGPAGRRGAQRSLVHHGLRHLAGGARRRARRQDAKSKSKARRRTPSAAAPVALVDDRRRSRCCPRAGTCGSRTRRRRAR